jgi:hypothetical protein
VCRLTSSAKAWATGLSRTELSLTDQGLAVEAGERNLRRPPILALPVARIVARVTEAGSALIHRIVAWPRAGTSQTNPALIALIGAGRSSRALTVSIAARSKAEAGRSSPRSMAFIGVGRRRSRHNRYHNRRYSSHAPQVRVTVTMAALGATRLPRTLFESALPS